MDNLQDGVGEVVVSDFHAGQQSDVVGVVMDLQRARTVARFQAVAMD